MRYAIVESGGKQYRAVEGSTIEVDRLTQEVGKKFDLDRVLFMGDGDEFVIGTPIVSGIKVTASVVEHVRGPKIVNFKYRPKKRIRVKSGHRQQYTRVMIEFIGRPGEDRKAQRAAEKTESEKAPRKVKQAKSPKKVADKRPAGKAEKKSTTKSSAKKADSKKK